MKSSTYLHTTPLPELPQSTRPHSISAKTKGQVACQPPSHPSKAWSVDKWTGICASGLGIYFLILPSNPPTPKKKFHICSCHFDDECEGGAKKYLGKYTNVQENARGQIFVTYPDISLSKQTNKPNKDITLYQTHMDAV